MSDPRRLFERFEPGRGSILVVLGMAGVLTLINFVAAGWYQKIATVDRRARLVKFEALVRETAFRLRQAGSQIDGCESIADISIEQILGPDNRLVQYLFNPPSTVDGESFNRWFGGEITSAMVDQISDPAVREAFLDGWGDREKMKLPPDINVQTSPNPDDL